MREQAQRRRSRLLPGWLWLPALAVAVLHCAPEERRADILLVTLDTTRADRLGCYGCTLASTPELDRFAEQAVLLENAITSVPLTLPAHTSILSGLSPPDHGVRNNASFRVDPQVEMLAEILSVQGYQCAAFVSSFVLHREFGLAQGFALYDDEIVGVERSAAETTDRAVAWLEAHARSPFFLWVHYFDPHTPWDPPEPFASQTRGAPYDAEISSMDAGLGRLLDALRGAGRLDQAHVVILADHGEGLGDHREYEHGIFLYEEVLRVPFLWKLPRQRAGRRASGLAGAIDLVPTLCDYLGVNPPAQVAGASLRPLLEGGEAPERPGLYAETMYPYYSYRWSPLYAWRTPEIKYVEAPEPELYDLARDRSETRNLARGRAATHQRLREQLRAHRSARGWEEAIPAEGEISAELTERLSSLGYIWSGGREGASPSDTLPDPKEQIAFHEHFELGKLAAQAGEHERAVRELGQLLAVYPDNHAATYFMAVSLVRVGRAADALPWLERHLEQAPDPNAALIMGEALLQLERPAEALEWFRRYLAEGPQEATAHERIGDALMALGRPDGAREAYRASAALDPSALLSRKRARAEVHRREFATAAELFAQGEQTCAIEERAYFAEWSAAARRLAVLGVEQPAAGESALIDQVRAAASLGLGAEATALLAATGTDCPEALRFALRGDIALAAQEWGAARRDYERAVALGRRSPDLYLRLAKTLIETGNRPAAERALRAGAEEGSDPGGLLHYNLACLLALRGESVEALAVLETALRQGRFTAAAVRGDPDLQSLHGEARFEELLRTVGGPSAER